MNAEDTVPRPITAPHLPPYVPAERPLGESKRLEMLARYRILDTAAEQSYDDMTMLASAVCGTPIALISLVDHDRQWFKSRVGLDAYETSRGISFCAHAILQPDQLFIVPDATSDSRFAGSPLVTGSPNIRFYAGAPLVTKEGAALGTICVIDRYPRELTAMQQRSLQSLARTVVLQLELRELVANLEEETLTDTLTGLWNRRAFNRRLREEWVRHSRSGQQLSLLMIDIDGFKDYNDKFGHQEGDQALVQTASLLSETLRENDFLVRHGGEEFAILLSETDQQQATLVAERLRLSISAASWPLRQVTVCIGVASVSATPHLDRNLLMARADQALYLAKRSGRNRVELFSDWSTGPSEEGS
jgi:diguanylate cyclase (GGDEF)-like protein